MSVDAHSALRDRQLSMSVGYKSGDPYSRGACELAEGRVVVFHPGDRHVAHGLGVAVMSEPELTPPHPRKR